MSTISGMSVTAACVSLPVSYWRGAGGSAALLCSVVAESVIPVSASRISFMVASVGVPPVSERTTQLSSSLFQPVGYCCGQNGDRAPAEIEISAWTAPAFRVLLGVGPPGSSCFDRKTRSAMCIVAIKQVSAGMTAEEARATFENSWKRRREPLGARDAPPVEPRPSTRLP